jgi:hypothetical protein
MKVIDSKLDRRGISLMEILIGIMVLGIGVISLATLFPLGLLQMKRAVNNTRGTIVAQSAWHEARIRNLVAPPFGPPAIVFTRYPDPWPPAPYNDMDPANLPYAPTSGPGVPIIIDPLWSLLSESTGYFDALGVVDLINNSTGAAVPDGNPDFDGAEGLLRVRGGSIPPALPMPLSLASAVFTSPDDLAYGDGDQRIIPLQRAVRTAPPFLSPTNGVPFDGVPFAFRTLERERRYTWLMIARKANARQGIAPGADGLPGAANTDDDGDGTIDNDSELGWVGSDDTLFNVGPDGTAFTLDDPAQDMNSTTAVPAPVGPFDVTIVAFYNRDFSTREAAWANPNAAAAPSLPRRVFVAGSDVAVLQKRPEIPFLEIPVGSYVMDSTLDSTFGGVGLRNGYVYRVLQKSYDAGGNLTLVLNQQARADGYALTVLKGAVGVFEKQVP